MTTTYLQVHSACENTYVSDPKAQRPELSRRSLLRNVGLTVASAAIPAGVGLAATPLGNGIRPEFAAAHAAIAQAEAAMYAHHPVFDAARARWTAAVASVPHVELTDQEGLVGTGLRYTTADQSMMRMCDALVSRHGRNAVPAARKLIAAQRWRERRLNRLGDETGMNAAYDRDESLSNAVTAAEDAFSDMRPLSIAELRLKVETINARNLWSNGDVPQILAADVLRLTAEG